MFGHQEPDQSNTDQTMQNEPAADATLAHGAPVGDSMPAPTATPTVSDDDNSDSAGDYIMTEPQHAVAPQADVPAAAAAPATVPAHGANDDLVDLKQKALQQLSPLVGHLDQTPEEKFRTTMMLIQASDNQALLKTAYEAAQAITDEKVRAQALLDVVNEINYFTQQEEAEA